MIPFRRLMLALLVLFCFSLTISVSEARPENKADLEDMDYLQAALTAVERDARGYGDDAVEGNNADYEFGADGDADQEGNARDLRYLCPCWTNSKDCQDCQRALANRHG